MMLDRLSKIVLTNSKKLKSEEIVRLVFIMPIKSKEITNSWEILVHFLGRRRDIPVLMRASVATLIASAQEGLPNCVRESLCMETPVIGTEIRGTRDLLVDGNGGGGKSGRYQRNGSSNGMGFRSSRRSSKDGQARTKGYG